MKVSVLCTVLNNESGIIRMLESLGRQTSKCEVVIVDGGSKDRTDLNVLKWTAANQGTTVKFRKVPGGCSRSEGFDLAAKMATGNVLAFLGSDDVAAHDWVENIMDAMKEGHDIIVGENILFGRGPKIGHVPLLVGGQDIAHAGTNTAYRASVYDHVGGFDTRFITAEDMDLNLRAVRAGYEITRAPSAVVYRQARHGAGIIHQAYWNGYGRGQLIAKHGPLPGMAGGAVRSITTPWTIPRLAAGYVGFLRGLRN